MNSVEWKDEWKDGRLEGCKTERMECIAGRQEIKEKSKQRKEIGEEENGNNIKKTAGKKETVEKELRKIERKRKK